MAQPRPHIIRRIPRGEKRRMELAGVAERLFVKHGFAETTMQMIASEAGSSKETLYRHFASKQALFAELISARAAAIAGPQSALASDEAPEKLLMGLGTSLMQLGIEARCLVAAEHCGGRGPSRAGAGWHLLPPRTGRNAATPDRIFAFRDAPWTAPLPGPATGRKAVPWSRRLPTSSAWPDRPAGKARDQSRNAQACRGGGRDVPVAFCDMILRRVGLPALTCS
jgi:AcrR family transcriptional regulator